MVNEPGFWLALTDTAVGAVTLIGGAAIFIAGLLQYRKGQNWKKAEMILSLIDGFESDPDIAGAKSILDWNVADQKSRKGRSIKINSEILVKALQLDDAALERTPEQVSICTSLDAFFDYFHKLSSFVESGLFRLEDYAYFFYWLDAVQHIGIYRQDPQVQAAMNEYVGHYQFIGFQRLSDLYNEHAEGKPIRTIVAPTA